MDRERSGRFGDCQSEKIAAAVGTSLAILSQSGEISGRQNESKEAAACKSSQQKEIADETIVRDAIPLLAMPYASI
uniref:Uncharacterized protein n=1 Tax=mine drainage metagenome TaxID=410659 RepID=E6QM92_9ZZZZ